jgi:PAS domain S-box-containing protein
LAVATTAGLGGFGPLADAMPDGIVIADSNGRMLYVNRSAEELSGYRREELVGLTVETLVPERFRGAHLEHRAGYAARPRTRPMGSGLAIHLLHKDGTERPVDIALSPVETAVGTIVVGAIRVATDRGLAGQAKRELSQSEERFRLVVSGVADYAIILLDPDGRVVSWNDGAQRIKGYESGEIIGQHFSRFYPPEEVTSGKPEQGLVAAAAQGRFEDQGWRIRKDGSRFWADIVITALRDEAGSLRGFLKITRDMTEHRRALDRLQAVADVTSAILEGQTGDNALRVIAAVARKLVGAAQAGVATPESAGGPMVVRAAVGGMGDAAVGMRASTELARVMHSGRTTIIAEAASDERLEYPGLVGNLGPVVIVPLKLGGRPLGALSLARTRGAAPYTAEDVSVAEAFAAQAAVALEYGRNLAEREKAERRVAAGMEVTQAIIEGRDTTDVLKLIAARARNLVGAAFAAIVSPEPAGDVLVARVTDGAQADAYRGSRLPVETSLTGRVFATRQSLTVADAAGDDRAYYPVLQMGNLGPALIVPLYVANRSIGAMIVANQRGGAAFTAEDLSVVESFAAQAAMSVEIATVRERLQRVTSVTILGQKPLEDALAALARTVVEATDTIACGIFLLDAERHLTIAGTYGLPQGFVGTMDLAFRRAGAQLPQMDAIESRALVVREGTISRFLSQPPSDPLWEPVHEMLRGVSWDTIVSVPLIHEGRVVGVLSGYYPRGYRLSDAETAFLKIVADQAAAIAENARLFTDAQAHVTLEERQRLARELHDSVSQALFGIALGARTALEHLERNPEAARSPLDYVLQLAEAGLAEMRALIFELRPEALEQEGLVGALAKQATALRARHGITVNEVFDAEPEVPIAVKEALFRIAQEALNNTAKHARASHVELRLTSAGGAIVIEIRDDGAGFDAGAQFPGHLGLQSMRERALRLGGNVEITSLPGKGTLIRAVIPPSPDPRVD